MDGCVEGFVRKFLLDRLFVCNAMRVGSLIGSLVRWLIVDGRDIRNVDSFLILFFSWKDFLKHWLEYDHKLS